MCYFFTSILILIYAIKKCTYYVCSDYFMKFAVVHKLVSFNGEKILLCMYKLMVMKAKANQNFWNAACMKIIHLCIFTHSLSAPWTLDLIY
jgi:hypothetical protein